MLPNGLARGYPAPSASECISRIEERLAARTKKDSTIADAALGIADTESVPQLVDIVGKLSPIPDNV